MFKVKMTEKNGDTYFWAAGSRMVNKGLTQIIFIIILVHLSDSIFHSVTSISHFDICYF